MPLIFYVTHDEHMFEANVPVGSSIMQGAIDNGIDGILGECGGNMSCATCHCYVDEKWLETVGVAWDRELEMIAAVNEPRPSSRLSCQITVTEAMEGLTVYLPKTQY